MKDMTWEDAIIQVLREEGNSMSSEDIANKILGRGYKNTEHNDNPIGTVGGILSKNEKGLFEHILEEGKCKGKYKLIDTFVTAPHSTVSRVVPPVVVRPCSSYAPSDPKYKSASDFVKDSSVLSSLEMDLLELIVNFRLPLEKGEVCFADILDNLEVQILEEERSRTQSVDATILEQKLRELKEQIADMEAENNPNLRNGNEYECKLGRMRSAAKEAERLLREASEGKVKFEYPILGEFVTSGSKPKVVIYLKSIENVLKSDESREAVMAGVFVHEMFHAWNYFIAGQMSKSVLAIDEPMVEFATLYFLKELEAFTESQYHSLKKIVSTVKSNRASRVHNKQQSIGDVAAYGFGYYLYHLYEKFGESIVDPIKWIETYSEKSASTSRYPQVKKVKKALIPVYPFKSENKVMKWFEEIIFSELATSGSARKSADAKVGLDVSLRKLVIACIETIGRKCFDAQELYAFAPIFKLLVPECINMEDMLKQQLDELVKEGHLEALPNDCYSKKLARVEVKPKDPAPTSAPVTTKPKKAKSIPYAVKFPDDNLTIIGKTAVESYIKSLKHIGLSKVQSAGIMKGGYNLVSDVEHPSNGEKKFQNYVDSKYIYTKLSNEDKKGFLVQIAYKLGIKIEIYDI